MQYSQRPGIPPVVLNLIILNFIVYLVANLIMPSLNPYLALYYPSDVGLFKPYQLLTYMFTHANFMHILFNMFALWMFGSQIENVWGAKKFLFFYLVCGLGAAGFNFLITYIQLANGASPMVAMYSLVGASGAIFGILAAYGMMFPNNVLMLLFPPIPMKAKYLVIGYAAIELFSSISGRADNIGHFAHLGGGLVGLILLLYWKARGELYKWF